MTRRQQAATWLLLGAPLAAFSVWAALDNTRLYFITLLNGLTLASLYFIVASGFTLVFGLMRNVNLAHGSLYLLGGYVGFTVAESTGWWVLALAAGFAVAAVAGLLMQWLILRHMQGQDLRQTMVTIGLSIVVADLLLWYFTGQVHQMEAPAALQGPIRDIPLIRAYSAYRLSLLGFGVAIGVGLWWLLHRTRIGMMIRAGVDDRAMLAAAGVNVNLLFAVTFALGAGLAGLGGVIGAPGLRADLQRRPHLRRADRRAGVPAARDHGQAGMRYGPVRARPEGTPVCARGRSKALVPERAAWRAVE
jgi:branched-chain amino acid transport system permease protein